MKKKLYKKIFKFIRNIFFILVLKHFWRYLFIRAKSKKVICLLKDIVQKTGKPVIIYVSYYDYYYKLIQRPNHIFNILSANGYPCVICSKKKNLIKPNENLFVIPDKWLKFVLAGNFFKVLDISLGYPYKDIKDINDYISSETLVFYELIDDFDLLVDKKTIERAKNMFIELGKREATYILVTADNLKYKAVKMGIPKSRIIDNKNAVILQDFQKNLPINLTMQKMKEKNKPIVGYYGALTASWFDFELMSNLVAKNPQWEFVLIGLLYSDNNLGKTQNYIARLSEYDNFTYIPPVEYHEIPSYARCWDVATIPFQINEITLGTSPVKLFEYMAMGLPIVATPMSECKLYKSVMIADGVADFTKKIKNALKKKNNQDYQKLLLQEASDNTWEKRVDDMIRIIKKHYKNVSHVQ